MIIRGSAEEVIAALSKRWVCPLGAIEAEAKALEAVVNFQGRLELEKQSLRVTHS